MQMDDHIRVCTAREMSSGSSANSSRGGPESSRVRDSREPIEGGTGGPGGRRARRGGRRRGRVHAVEDLRERAGRTSAGETARELPDDLLLAGGHAALRLAIAVAARLQSLPQRPPVLTALLEHVLDRLPQAHKVVVQQRYTAHS